VSYYAALEAAGFACADALWVKRRTSNKIFPNLLQFVVVIFLGVQLRALGRGVESASVYAFMQNVGVVNDHVHGCFRAIDCRTTVPEPLKIEVGDMSTA
jgi:hypothetical protein